MPRPAHEQCDVCGCSTKGKFAVDGKLKLRGPWAWMCLTCYADHGSGLGVGKGQMFDKDGKKVRA